MVEGARRSEAGRARSSDRDGQQDLKSAYARFLQARAALGIADAQNSPQVNLNSSISQNQRSANSRPLFSTRNYSDSVSYTHLRAHETRHDIVCRLLLE